MKTFYSVDIHQSSYPVHYIDSQGIEQITGKYASAADACEEFERAMPGAQYLNWREFERRLDRIATDRERLKGWLKL